MPLAGAVVLVVSLLQFAQAGTGELRVAVADPAGLPLKTTVEVVSEANDVRQRLDTDANGVATFRQLPFGRYAIEIAHAGFAPVSDLVDIRTALPTEHRVALTVAPLRAEVTVGADQQTLVDAGRQGTVARIGARTIETRVLSLPGRSLPALIDTQPGWLLEANGILHPRGSEYQTQYVIDGLPLTDNRSPSFAPEIDADSVHSLNIITSGYPAEYGRKLGGVVEVVTGDDPRRGAHGSVVASAASFGTLGAFAQAQYGWQQTNVSVSGNAARTDRYLDPPVEENFTNHGTGSNAAVHVEHDFGDGDRFGAIVRRGAADFLVPNEREQEAAGQRQSRRTSETTAQFSYLHVFNGNTIGEARAMLRDLSAGLASNAASTPIVADQDRGVRDLYARATVTRHAGSHEWKAGFDLVAGSVRERFSYRITDPGEFDAGTPPSFAFDADARDREQALFVQDQWHAGAWTVNAGLRWDRYSLIVTDQAFSPRISVGWAWPGHDLIVRGSYDRAFQTPAIENLLLASSPQLDVLSTAVVRLPVRPSRGNFFDVGISKALGGRVRIDVSRYRRSMTNFADDDLLLNTGVSFPIAFRQATIDGTEVSLSAPQWGRFNGTLAWSNMLGFGYLPVTGGLLLGDEAGDELASTSRFPVTQDQRNTIRARGSWQVTARAWLAASWAYGSGLPVEFTGDPADAVAQYGDRIASRVNFARGRVRPSAALDLSAGLTLAQGSRRRARLQVDVINVTNRLNVIDFAGVFSGTALAAPRSAAARLQLEF